MSAPDPIEIPFLGEWNDLRRERRQVRERLAKLDQEQGRFSETVLARVRVDYERRMREVELRVSDLAERARREVTSLTTAVQQQEEEVRDCRLGLEEVELRESLGEEIEPEMASDAASRRELLTRLEDDLRAMVELLDRVRTIAEGRTGSQSQSTPVRSSSARLELLPPLPPLTPSPQPQQVTRPRVEPETEVPAQLAANHDAPGEPRLIPPPPAPEAQRIPRLVPSESVDGLDHYVLLAHNVVGRVEECELRLPVGTVSRRHAEIEWTGESWVVRDLHSENGTWVNGERIWERTLMENDQLQFGTVCLYFRTD
jgi:hypothetical protein